MERSFYELIKLSINLLKTKLFFPKARLIRFPFDIRGKKYIWQKFYYRNRLPNRSI